MNDCYEKLKPYTSLFLRIGLGVIFIYHGFGKVFGAGMNLGTAWNPGMSLLSFFGFPISMIPGMSVALQAMVAWGEFVGGLAILLGFLTRKAAAGIIIIMLGAIFTVHGKNGFSLMNHGFEYNFALIMMCLALIAGGTGPFSIGCRCSKEKES